MPPTDSPGDSSRRAPGPGPRILAVLLLANLVLLGGLFFSQGRLGRRLDKLEATTGDRTQAVPGRAPGERPTLAGRPERIALLLAAATDAEATRRLLETMPPGERQEIARTLMSRPAGNDRNAALGALLQKTADDDPAQAVALLAAVPEVGVRQTVAARIAAVWIEHDPAGGAAWLAGDGPRFLSPPVLDRLQTAAVNRWLAFDPAAATKFVAIHPATAGVNAHNLMDASREWARRDPATALAWTQSLPAGDPRASLATVSMLEGWAEIHPVEAAGYVGQLSYGPGHTYSHEASAVASSWTPRDPAAAARWASGLSDALARDVALRLVAASWARLDVASASRWAATLPASPNRGAIWRGISGDYVAADPGGTESWLSTLPAGPDRDAAVAAYAAMVEPADPEKALTWAKTLSDEAFSTQQIRDLLRAWSRRDAFAARNWAVANQFGPVPADGNR